MKVKELYSPIDPKGEVIFRTYSYTMHVLENTNGEMLTKIEHDFNVFIYLDSTVQLVLNASVKYQLSLQLHWVQKRINSLAG